MNELATRRNQIEKTIEFALENPVKGLKELQALRLSSEQTRSAIGKAKSILIKSGDAWAKHLHAQNWAARQKIDVERAMGAILAKFVPHQGGRKRSLDGTVFSLSDVGLTKNASSRFQKMAQWPNSLYLKFIDDCNKHEIELTSKAVLLEAKAWIALMYDAERDDLGAELDELEGDTGPDVKLDDWWQLGSHLLYCGNTEVPKFRRRVKSATFAFADPPYNAGVADWDRDFKWRHNWLSKSADVVAVTPGTISIFDFFRVQKMPYVWSFCCWITNGHARGALGFANWIYVALFSNQSIFREAQDFCKITLKSSENKETRHKGRKPSSLLLHLVELFSEEDETIIDPFLGSGTTLLSAEKLGRRCIGGEIDPKFCSEVIARWEKLTGEKAKKC